MSSYTKFFEVIFILYVVDVLVLKLLLSGDYRVISSFNCYYYFRRRLEKRIYIPLPNFESRKELIRINLKTVEVNQVLFVKYQNTVGLIVLI